MPFLSLLFFRFLAILNTIKVPPVSIFGNPPSAAAAAHLQRDSCVFVRFFPKKFES